MPADRWQSPAGWTAPRTPWGEPDIQGLFTTDDELGVPFERPATIGTRETVTDAEFAAREAQRPARQADADAEEFVAPRGGRGRAGGRGGNPEGGGGVGPPAHWLERGRPSRRTSIVIDPPDGRIPFLNDEARKRAAVAVNARTSGQKPYDGPRGARPLRPLHHARPAARDLPDDLQQHVADRAGPGLCGDPLRDDSRHAGHSDRTAVRTSPRR